MQSAKAFRECSPTADLLTQRMQMHEKNAWMLRSMLDTEASAKAA